MVFTRQGDDLSNPGSPKSGSIIGGYPLSRLSPPGKRGARGFWPHALLNAGQTCFHYTTRAPGERGREAVVIFGGKPLHWLRCYVLSGALLNGRVWT